jgi:hypothetical protein
MDNDDHDRDVDPDWDLASLEKEEPPHRFRLYPITYAVIGAVLGIGLFHAWTYDPDAVRIPFGDEWVGAIGGDPRDILVERITTLCVLGSGQDRRALPQEPAGARGGSPSQVPDTRIRLIALDADGRFLVEADRRRSGRAPTLDAIDPAWCAPVSKLAVEEYPGVDGLGEGAKIRRIE